MLFQEVLYPGVVDYLLPFHNYSPQWWTCRVYWPSMTSDAAIDDNNDNHCVSSDIWFSRPGVCAARKSAAHRLRSRWRKNWV